MLSAVARPFVKSLIYRNTNIARTVAISLLNKSSTAMTKQKQFSTSRSRRDLDKRNIGTMLQHEETLPRLPVPSLQDTAAKYLKSVHPLVSEKEYKHTEKVVQDFIKPGGIGEKLQEQLVAKANETHTVNWLSEWWNDAAYLSYRDPVVFFVSYFYSHRDDRKRRTPASRAAALSTATLQFRREIQERTLAPSLAKKTPQTMASYDWLFNACRIPGQKTDHGEKYEPHDNAHIIVIRKNKFFLLPHEYNGQQLSTAELETQFEKIIELAGNQKDAPIGALSGDNRDLWNESRNELIAADPKNETLLHQIQAASFVVCLDDTSPVTLEERATELWHGDGENRFYDKPAQLVVFENGASGFLGEHSMMDGTPTHRLNSTICDLIARGKIDLGSSANQPHAKPLVAPPKQLQFTVTDAISRRIQDSLQNFHHRRDMFDLRVQYFQGYGADLMKRFKCSPDAYIQMLLQLAYYKMYGICRPTYESAATFKFRDGRTETCRTVSDESVAFCKAMENPAIEISECLDLARKAFAAHVKFINEAGSGLGVDRHFFGLKKFLPADAEVPAVYTDPAFTYSASWYISSSQLSSEYYNGYGWGPVIEDGYGLAYQVHRDSFSVNITCRKHNPNSDIPLSAPRMQHLIREAADDMRLMFLSELEVKAKL